MSISLMLILLVLLVWLLPRLEARTAGTDHSYETKVFNQKKVSTIDIQVDEESLQKILESPLEKEVVPATVVFNGEKIQEVGFRVKGNMTLRSVAQMENSDRYSFKVDFDYYKDGQSLFGLKKLALNNNYSDSTLSKEFVSYKLMDEMGVPTPANSYMYVTINGEEWGLYLGVEAIDETFLANHFTNANGDLYKPDGTGSDLKWISDDVDEYTGLGLKTNEETSTQSAMMKFLDVINHGGNLDEVMDVDEMLRYFAANTALVNLDHYQGTMKHNYYLYEQNGKFSILPWDYNMSFGGFSGGGPRMSGNAGGFPGDKEQQNEQDIENGGREFRGFDMVSGMGDMMSESNINFSITEPVSGTTLEERPLLNALLENEEYREKYNRYLEQIANEFFDKENMQNIMSSISSTILPYVEQDPKKFTTTEQFLAGVSGDNSLVEFAAQRSESILKQLSGELVVEADNSNPPDEFNNNEGNNEEMNKRPVPGEGEQPGRPEGLEEGERPEPPGGMGQPGAGGPPPDMMNQGFMGGEATEKESFSRSSLIGSILCLGFLLVAILFVKKFQRRRV